MREARESVLVMNVVNVLQPASDEELDKQLAKQVKSKSVKEFLELLMADGKVRRLPDDRYVVTFNGLKMFGSSKLTKRRDVLRMLHLVEQTKRG